MLKFLKRKFKRDFSGGELLERVFDSLVRKTSYQQIDLPVDEDWGVCAIISNDSDAHRTRRGFMEYRNLFICEFEKNIWAIGLGQSRGSYPARPYCNDIIALKTPKEPKEEITNYFINQIYPESNHFKNSLVHSASTELTHDGSLRLVGAWKISRDEWNPFGEKILSLVEGKFRVVKPSFVDRENLLAKLYPLDYKEGDALYSRNHSKILTDILTNVLSY